MTESDRIKIFNKEMTCCIPHLINADTIEFLIKAGFFKKPASVNHHGNYEGALFDHSLAVVKNLLFLTEKLGLKWSRPESPYVVGMFHDLCKIDDYVKNSYTGEWEYAKDKFLPGHGDKSVIMIQMLLGIQLTIEEFHCIRWHMGAFDDKENWGYYSSAVADFPNVLYTHTADMIASQIEKI